MAVDFAIKKTPRYRVVSVRFVGPFNEKRIRTEWERLAKWAKTKRLSTGKWFFSEEDAGKAYRFDGHLETMTWISVWDQAFLSVHGLPE